MTAARPHRDYRQPATDAECTCEHYVVDRSDPEPYHPENVDRELDPNCLIHGATLDDPADDDAPAVLDLLSEAAEAVAAAGLLVDELPNLRRAEMPGPGQTLDAWQQHRASAWLSAESKAAQAWRDLQSVVSLLRGLSGLGSV